MRIQKEEFEGLKLYAHTILKGIPLKDVTAIDLPGGGVGKTISSVMALLTPDELTKPNIAVRFLFWLRYKLGVIFKWEKVGNKFGSSSFIYRIDPEIQKQSVLKPGTKEGPFTMLYVLPFESLGEIQNKTVHAFLCSHLEKTEDGYRLFWGIYVSPTSWLTPLYMAIIEPFRRYIVYPAIFRKIKKAWVLKVSKEMHGAY